MRTIRTLLLAAALALPAMAAEAPPSMTIGIEPLGDTARGVVVRFTFRFPSAELPDQDGLFLIGSVKRGAEVVRDFRYPVAAGKGTSITAIETLAEGEYDADARIMAPLDESASLVVAKGESKFSVSKTGHPYVASETDGAEAIVAEGSVPEHVGAVTIQTPRRDVALNLFIVPVDVKPPVTRVEFMVGDRKVLARNAPPYEAELDLGKLPKRVEVRAIGYDEAGRYVDADAFVVNERDTPLEVKITRTETPDGVSHFRLSLQNPKQTVIRSVALFAGDRKLREWTEPPYALDLPASALAGTDYVRAAVVDETGYEAADIYFLAGNRFMDSIDVNVVELPVLVTSEDGTVVTGLEMKDFTVLENGKPQKISSFAFSANLPLSIGVLLDHSGSMEPRIKQAKSAAVTFFEKIMKRGDRAFFAPFASDPSKTAPFVSSIDTLRDQVNEVPDAEGGTALYDAIVTGLYRFRNLQGQKALVVITDGADTTSRLGYQDVLTYARASRVPLYFVGIGIAFGRFGGGPMKSLAEETGGTAIFVRGAEQLGEAYQKLENDLRSQYLVTYESESSTNDQDYRTVEVNVARPGTKVRTIRGYIP